jgi:hypothetical protein
MAMNKMAFRSVKLFDNGTADGEHVLLRSDDLTSDPVAT